jgi:hypothetical protein
MAGRIAYYGNIATQGLVLNLMQPFKDLILKQVQPGLTFQTMETMVL